MGGEHERGPAVAEQPDHVAERDRALDVDARADAGPGFPQRGEQPRGIEAA